MRRAIKRQLSDTTQTLDWFSRRLISPAAYIAHERMKLQALQSRLGHATRIPLSKAQFALYGLTSALFTALRRIGRATPAHNVRKRDA